MPRPKIRRWIEFKPGVNYFKPRGVPLRFLEEINLAADEIEALRLADAKGLDQIKAAREMKISQSTFQRILASARNKVAQGLIEGKAIRIENRKRS